MRYKVIFTKECAVEIPSELEKEFDTDNSDSRELKIFNSFNSALEYVLSKDCIYSPFLVVEIAGIPFVIAKRNIGDYDDFTFIKAFVSESDANKFKDNCLLS